MKQRIYKRTLSLAIMLSMFVTGFIVNPLPALASETQLKGTQYQFDDDCKYVIKDAKDKLNLYGATQFGKISLSGSVSSISDVNNVQAFEVSSGTVAIKYDIDVKDSLDVVDDKVKKVSNAEIEDNVLSGAIIVQTSLDGENWIVDKVFTDILDEESEFDSLVYESNYVQQANGCYFRVLVAYKTEKMVEESSIWFVDTSDYEQTRWAEVYKFYLIDKERGNAGSVNTTPRMVFQDSEYRIKTEKNNGYTGVEEETIDDPHYGWSLGEFTINGYTASDNDSDNTPVFLKNVGDQVTLWFTLNQDINKLNGNEDLSISEDKEGWDEYFGITKTNFKKGTLIIRQTDAEGSAKDPVIYTNYLEANVRTGADTKVRLFEEGDYEVALDYEIEDTDGWDSVTNYRLFFKFKIRNSNCMIFPFDLETQSELTDHSIAKNGFRLDYANSKYLDVYVEQKDVNFNGTSYSEDTRGNKSAKDGSEYTDEGIYVISVQHDYNNSRTTEKTIYVGDSPIIKALSRNNITVADINNLLAQGYKINNDGGLVSNTGDSITEEESDEVEEVENTNVEKPEVETNKADNAEVVEPSVETEKSSDSFPAALYVGIVGVIAFLGVMVLKNRKANEVTTSDDITENEIQVDKNNVDKEEE